MTRSACVLGAVPIFLLQSEFLLSFGILFDYYACFNGFSSFLGDIGHFWSPNFGRKLGMDNQL
jgi:hypothetical protein